MVELGDQYALSVLCALAPADVTHDADEQALSTGGHLGNGEVHRERLPGLAPPLDLPPRTDDPGLPPLTIALQIAVVRATIGLSRQHADVVPDHFLRCVAKHL